MVSKTENEPTVHVRQSHVKFRRMFQEALGEAKNVPKSAHIYIEHLPAHPKTPFVVLKSRISNQDFVDNARIPGYIGVRHITFEIAGLVRTLNELFESYSESRKSTR